MTTFNVAIYAHSGVLRQAGEPAAHEALYREMVGRVVSGIDALRAKRKPNLPVVLTREEVKALLLPQQGQAGRAVRLLYGCGLRASAALGCR